jgi:hypothetical protein
MNELSCKLPEELKDEITTKYKGNRAKRQMVVPTR